MSTTGKARDTIRIVPLPGIPEVERGSSLARLVIEAAARAGVGISHGDVVAVAQKIISKSEGRLAQLEEIEPSTEAIEQARRMNRDPRSLEVILGESKRVVRATERVLISETRHGWICANAGVDQSNVPAGEVVSLLPLDPDASARRLRAEIEREAKARVAVIITDTFGRPWRLGLTNVAIGAAGLQVLKDYREFRDSAGRPLQSTLVAVADELAAASGLAMGKTSRVPAVVIRGYKFEAGESKATEMIRPKEEDLFP